jgi:hypothetical protein
MRLFLQLTVALQALSTALQADEKKPAAFALKLKPAVVGKDDSELLRLRKERFNTTADLVRVELARFASGQRDSVMKLGMALDRLVSAGLELELGPKERLAILEECVRISKDAETVVAGEVEAGQITVAELLRMRVFRLDAEIRLAREKERGKK